MHRAHMAIDVASLEERVQTCTEHAQAVAKLEKGYLAAVGLENTGKLLGLLHDMGKFTDEFDDYLNRAFHGEKVRKGSVIHTFAGVRYLLEQFHRQGGQLSLQDVMIEVLAVSVGSHHGYFDLWDENHTSGFQHRLTCQTTYDHRAIAAFHQECAVAEEVKQLVQQSVEELCECWRHVFRPQSRPLRGEPEFALGVLVRLLTSALIDADRTDTRCFMQSLPCPMASKTDWSACAAHVNAYVHGFSRESPIQQARGVFSDQCAAAAVEKAPGVYRLDLPTGGGKTLAALRFAVLHAEKYQLDSVFYVAPLLSVIDQNVQAIREAVGESMMVLEHHSDVLRDDMSPEEAAEVELLQENWDAPMIVTTMVQLLNTMFSGKTSCVRRFHRLCRSVLILDEVQSLPTRLMSMFNCTINFLVNVCGATVVLCSATQPALDGAKVAHPLISPERLISQALFDQYAPCFRRTKIQKAQNYRLEQLSAWTEEIVEQEGRVLVVCNTKREARELFQLLTEISSAHLYHLSAGMCMAHRENVLRELRAALQAREKLICVSTQVIEAGIDISFDCVIRLSAGLDSVVQTAGRCNRHGEHATPQPVWVCSLIDEQLGSLKEIVAGQNALAALLAENPEKYHHDLSSDEAVRMYYSYLYADMPVGAQDDVRGSTSLFEMLSTNRQFAKATNEYYLNQAFRTAGEAFSVFDEENETILVPYATGKEVIAALQAMALYGNWKEAEKQLEQAKKYSVSVSKNQLKRMLQNGVAFPMLDGRCYAMNEGYYDEHAIGMNEEAGKCNTLIL